MWLAPTKEILQIPPFSWPRQMERGAIGISSDLVTSSKRRNGSARNPVPAAGLRDKRLVSWPDILGGKCRLEQMNYQPLLVSHSGKKQERTSFSPYKHVCQGVKNIRHQRLTGLRGVVKLREQTPTLAKSCPNGAHIVGRWDTRTEFSGQS